MPFSAEILAASIGQKKPLSIVSDRPLTAEDLLVKILRAGVLAGKVQVGMCDVCRTDTTARAVFPPVLSAPRDARASDVMISAHLAARAQTAADTPFGSRDFPTSRS